MKGIQDVVIPGVNKYFKDLRMDWQLAFAGKEGTTCCASPKTKKFKEISLQGWEARRLLKSLAQTEDGEIPALFNFVDSSTLEMTICKHVVRQDINTPKMTTIIHTR